MKIYLVRHTAVDVPEGTCYGQTDVPLKNTFEEEAGRVKQGLEGLVFDTVCSSSLSRCTRLAKHCGFEDVRLYDRLREFHFGDWEMRNWNDFDMSSWEDAAWVDNPSPDGECFRDMYARVKSFFDEIKSEQHENVLVFAHAGVISCARVYFDNIPLEKAFEIQPKYGEILEFTL